MDFGKFKNMVWSYSRLTSFEQCKYCFYLNYIINNDDLYLSEGNFYAELGIYVHEILAKIFSGEMTPDEASQYYVDHFDENISYKVKKSIMKNSFEKCAEYFSIADFGWLKSYEILGVEMKTQFEISGYPFIGYIDLLLRDKADGKIVLVDNKSSEYPFKKDGSVKSKMIHTFDKYKKQMYLYCYGIKEIYGEFPKKITWNHFKEDGGRFCSIPFKEKEFDEAVQWMVEAIETIKNEEQFEPNQDYFYCKNLCNFRNSCEYNAQEQRKYWRSK